MTTWPFIRQKTLDKAHTDREHERMSHAREVDMLKAALVDRDNTISRLTRLLGDAQEANEWIRKFTASAKSSQ